MLSAGHRRKRVGGRRPLHSLNPLAILQGDSETNGGRTCCMGWRLRWVQLQPLRRWLRGHRPCCWGTRTLRGATGRPPAPRAGPPPLPFLSAKLRPSRHFHRARPCAAAGTGAPSRPGPRGGRSRAPPPLPVPGRARRRTHKMAAS